MLTDSTIRLLGLANDCATRSTSSPNDAFGAITLSVTAIEHFVNYVPEVIKFTYQTRTGSVSQHGRTDGFLILQELNERRGSLRIRIATLCFLLSGNYPDKGSELFQHIHFAIDIRNEIVHLTHKIVDPAKMPHETHPSWVKRLKEKKILSDEVDWLTPDQIAERPETARWVLKTTFQFFDYLGQMNDKDHFITGIFHPNSSFRLFSRLKEKLPAGV